MKFNRNLIWGLVLVIAGTQTLYYLRLHKPGQLATSILLPSGLFAMGFGVYKVYLGKKQQIQEGKNENPR